MMDGPSATDDAMSSPIEVTYRMSDLFAVSFRNWRVYLRSLLILEMTIVVVIVGIALLDGASFRAAVGWLELEVLAVLGLAVLVLWVVILAPISYVVARMRGTLGPHCFYFGNDGVTVAGAKANSTHYWSGLRRVIRSNDRLYLYISAGLAFILPKRAFTTDDDFDRWSEFAMAHWLAARTH